MCCASASYRSVGGADDGGGDAKLLCVPADKRYDHIIEPAAVRADAYFNPVDSWYTLLNPDTNAVSTTRGHPRPPRHSTLLWGLLVAKRAEHPGFHVIGVMAVKCPLTGVVSD